MNAAAQRSTARVPQPLAGDARPSWIRRLSAWGIEIVMAGPDSTERRKEKGRARAEPIAHYTLSEGTSLTYPMRTTDRREWQVEIEWEAVEALAGQTGVTRDEVERMLVTNAHHLEFAALRAIARGNVTGDRVVLTRAMLAP